MDIRIPKAVHFNFTEISVKNKFHKINLGFRGSQCYKCRALHTVSCCVRDVVCHSFTFRILNLAN